MAEITASNESSPVVGIALELREYSVVPGSSVEISVTILNLGTEEDHFELAVRGIPLSWVSIPTPVVRLAAGGKINLSISVQVPPPPQSQAGHYPLSIIATSQSKPEENAEVEALLRIAAFEAQGRIGVMMQSIQFSAAPGSSVPVSIVLLNQGLVPDEFRLSVEGIPIGWVSAASPMTHLDVGERKEITLIIQPQRLPQNKAGRYPFRIRVTSQNMAEQSVSVDCMVTLAVYTQFSASIDPPLVEAGKPAQVVVANQGNAQDVFTLTWQSDNDSLIFEPGAIQSLKVGAGESEAVGFIAKARQQPVMGGDTMHRFTTHIQSSGNEGLTVGGEVVSRAMIPVWVLPLVLALCLGVIALAAFFLGRVRNPSGDAEQTAVAETQTATAVFGQFLSATQTAAFNMTQAALAGEQDDDGDGLTNRQEQELGTNPNNPDTDGDLLNDSEELRRGTKPLDPDTDRDIRKDGEEVVNGTDPLNPDTDGDGITDGVDPNPLDRNNPSLTASAIAGQPTSTPVTPTPPPTVTPTAPPTDTPPAPPTATLTQTQVPLPVRGIIAFESNREGNSGIFAFDSADSSVSMLSLSNGTDSQPVFSPDGSLIAFSSDRDGNNEIYIMNANGSGQTNLTMNPANDLDPTWSPDGQWIGFTSDRDGNQEIYILRTDRSEIINLSNNPAADYQPTWLDDSGLFSTDDEHIAFTSNRDGNQEIFLMLVDGNEQINISNHPADDFSPKGTHSGDRIVFVSTRDGSQDVFIMYADGSSQGNLTNNPAQDTLPAWSPDANWIAFTSDRDGNQEVYVMKNNGADAFNLTQNPAQDLYPAWR